MNDSLQRCAREELKRGLAQLPERHHHVFKLMYSHKNLNKPINNVVDDMPWEKLDWAMQQVGWYIEKGG